MLSSLCCLPRVCSTLRWREEWGEFSHLQRKLSRKPFIQCDEFASFRIGFLEKVVLNGLFQKLNYKGTESGAGHEDDFPLNFVEETVELPCGSKVDTSDKIMRQ